MPDAAAAPETPSMSPRKTEITRIAGSLFAERGFHGTSLREIGAAVGLRRGSIYSHFESKEEILKLLLDPAVAALREALAGVAERRDLDGCAKLEEAMRVALACAEQHRDAIVILSQDRRLIDESPVLRDTSLAAKAIAPIWMRCITEGQGDGSIRADVAPSTIALALISLLVGALSDRHLGVYAAPESAGRDPAELARQATRLIFAGITPR